MSYRYSSRYPSAPPPPRRRRISFRPSGTTFRSPDHYVVEPPPPPPAKSSKPVERDPGPRFTRGELARNEQLTYEILASPTFPAISAAYRVFIYEMQERVRMAYKPPPPHWRSFSKMLPTYADDDWKLRRKRGRPRNL